eukprot:scaffold98_cov248-Ochromonas_danica.AAC.23
MMLSIFRYIDRIVTEIVKPKKLLFLAIDGVAPRAKLNQQRARRFRAAQDRTESIEKAKQRGEVIDENTLFDSNCITPGTEFMEVVNRHLKWFIRKKMKEDPLWSKLEVIYSGHDVPGEGEHKIMTYIRDLRANAKYEPNLRHCMYGQDADLIMLALATHEPHFALLREVINFNTNRGRRSAREVVMKQTAEAQFQLLHISLLREYIALDFGHNQELVMDHERVIDDFIFLTFLVGNDFLPHLPTLDISEHAFDTLINAYRELWSQSAGYIVENGEIQDLKRLEDLFAIIGQQEGDILAKREQESKEFRHKQRGRMMEDIEEEEESEEAKEEALQAAFEAALKEAIADTPSAELTSVNKEKKEEAVEEKKDFAGRYYYEKFKVIRGSSTGDVFLETLMENYLQGLMWCLAYYVKGCISWTWFYPYHYGPMLQDMKNLQVLVERISFSLGQPFTPYQQLLGCLPPASCNLMPKCYQYLMTNAQSPVIEFYPEEFSVDMDGKKNPWEAVVLLPFLDEERLRHAEMIHCPVNKLSQAEVHRNQFGALLGHTYDPTVMETYLSCNPEIGLPDIVHCFTRVTPFPFSLAPGEFFKSCLLEGTEYPIAGYPSLSSLPLASVQLEKIKVNVFGSASRYNTLAIEVNSPDVTSFDQKVVEKLLGRSVFINYPHMHEAKVVGVSMEKQEWHWTEKTKADEEDKIEVIVHDDVTALKWKTQATKEETDYLSGRSLPGTGGLGVGWISIRLLCRPLIGMKRNASTGQAVKIFSKDLLADVPIQLALWKPLAKDDRFVETSELSVEELYPLGVKLVAVKGPLKGCVGMVVGPHGYGLEDHIQRKSVQRGENGNSTTKQKRVVDVDFLIPHPAPAFGHAIRASVQEEYFGTRDCCQLLQISPSLLGKIAGSILIEPGRLDIGLNLKRNGMYQLLGYVRRVESNNAPGAAASAGRKGPKQNNSTPSVIGVPIHSRNAWQAKDSVDIIGILSQDEKLAEKGFEKDAIYWEYSSKAILLIAEYLSLFPHVFQALQQLPHQPVYQISDLFGSGGRKGLVNSNKLTKENTVDPILRWMQSQPFFHIPRSPLTTTSLSREAMAAIERAADVHTTLNQTKGYRTLTVRGIRLEHLYCNLHRTANDLALTFNSVEPALGDRIVNLSCLGVPLGLKGTVVAIHHEGRFVDVIFDEEFMGGKNLQGGCSPFRGRLCAWSDLLLLNSSAVVSSANKKATASSTSTSTKSRESFGSNGHNSNKRMSSSSTTVVIASGTVASKDAALDKVLENANDLVVNYDDCNGGGVEGEAEGDDGLDELFQSSDMTEILALIAKRKPSDGSGLAKLAALAGVTIPSRREPFQPNVQVTSTTASASSGSHTTASKATAALKQALTIGLNKPQQHQHHQQSSNAQPPRVITIQKHGLTTSAAASQHHHHEVSPAMPSSANSSFSSHSHTATSKTTTTTTSILDKGAATRMVKHQLGIHGNAKRDSASSVSTASSDSKSSHLPHARESTSSNTSSARGTGHSANASSDAKNSHIPHYSKSTPAQPPVKASLGSSKEKGAKILQLLKRPVEGNGQETPTCPPPAPPSAGGEGSSPTITTQSSVPPSGSPVIPPPSDRSPSFLSPPKAPTPPVTKLNVLLQKAKSNMAAKLREKSSANPVNVNHAQSSHSLVARTASNKPATAGGEHKPAVHRAVSLGDEHLTNLLHKAKAAMELAGSQTPEGDVKTVDVTPVIVGSDAADAAASSGAAKPCIATMLSNAKKIPAPTVDGDHAHHSSSHHRLSIKPSDGLEAKLKQIEHSFEGDLKISDNEAQQASIPPVVAPAVLNAETAVAQQSVVVVSGKETKATMDKPKKSFQHMRPSHVAPKKK